MKKAKVTAEVADNIMGQDPPHKILHKIWLAENKRSIAVVGVTFPGLFQLRCRCCRAPPRSQTHTRPESPGWSSWNSVWWRGPPPRIYTKYTTNGKQRNEWSGNKRARVRVCLAAWGQFWVYLLVRIRFWVVWTWQVTVRTWLLPATFCKKSQCPLFLWPFLFTFLFFLSQFSHPCVYGCSFPHLFGRGSLDDRHTQTRGADSGHCHT